MGKGRTMGDDEGLPYWWDEYDDGDTALCRHCGEPIRRTTMDDAVPWIHLHSRNGHCDVTSPESAVLSSWANWTGLRDVAEPA